MTDPAPPRIPHWVPAAAVVIGVLALALVARPAHSVLPLPPSGPLSDYRPPMAIGAVVLLAGVASLYARYRDDGQGVLARAGRACAVLLSVAVVASPIAVLFLGHKPAGPASAQPAPTQVPSGGLLPTPPKPTPTNALPTGNPNSWLNRLPIGQIVALLLLAGVAALVVYILTSLWRARNLLLRLAQRTENPQFGALEGEELADAVDAATEALDVGGDAQEAVIACYAAMEDRMGLVGVERGGSDSPEDLLARARRAGLVRGAAADRLTQLFQEARFSRHRIGEAQREAARIALQEIAADLREIQAAREAAS